MGHRTGCGGPAPPGAPVLPDTPLAPPDTRHTVSHPARGQNALAPSIATSEDFFNCVALLLIKIIT